jgi:hypothetical protein
MTCIIVFLGLLVVVLLVFASTLAAVVVVMAVALAAVVVVVAVALAAVVVVVVVALAMVVVVVAVVMPAVALVIVVNLMDEQVIVVFGDQLDGGVNLDEAEILCVLEQGGAVAGQDVLHCRTWHREGAARFVNDADLAPIDTGATAHALQLHLAARLIDGLHKNDAKLASLYSFQGYVHSFF